jgi:CDP-diacylglycerol--glycerol-3-phosphate 3-phosphatidyltransferase
LEQRGVEPNIVHCVLDDYIPFCEYFIVPYILWFGFAAVTLWYFAFRCRNREEYWQLTGILGVGMTVFLITSFLYPNGQNLRPVLQNENLFVWAVSILYKIDTPTNILPSMHVFIAAACGTAICRNRDYRNDKKLILGTGLLTVLIILSTMFLKQHSVIDVCLALILYAVCYEVFYKILPQYKEQISGILTKEEIFTIPNLLSMFRLVLAGLFLGIYQKYGGMAEKKELLTGILILSGITDFLDGKIARKFHMVSEVGKILDPIADKVTQGVLIFCLLSKYSLAKGVFALFLVKECYMAVMGTKTIMKLKMNDGAKWYGKISTAVFYTVMFVLIFYQNITERTANQLILCCGGCMLLAFIMYAHQYNILLNEKMENKNEVRREYL